MTHEAGEFSTQLSPDVNAATVARGFVTEHSDKLPPELVADAELLASELVTNAVLHGAPTITLHVRLDPPQIGVSVHDEGEELPSTDPAAPPTSATSGRGLMIVDAVSAEWGVIPTDHRGKTVWFRLAADVQ